MNLVKTVGALLIVVMALYVVMTLIGFLAATIATLSYLIVVVGLVAITVLVLRHRRRSERPPH